MSSEINGVAGKHRIGQFSAGMPANRNGIA
jgi:hypothetical protein